MAIEPHEVYPNAPVALVAVEIRFPGEVGGPLSPEAQQAVTDALGEDWVTEAAVVPGISVNLGGGLPMTLPGSTILRFVDRERGAALAFTAGSLSVETTRYLNWPAFRAQITSAVDAAGEALRPVGVTRVGVRFIDELRAPNADGMAWGRWLSPTLLPPAAEAMVAADWPALAWGGAVQYTIGRDRSLVLNYGPKPAVPGWAVPPDGALRRSGPRPAGPFFLLDFDASWQPAAVPRWDGESLLETCDELRHPVRTLFDLIVTADLVENIFKEVASE